MVIISLYTVYILTLDLLILSSNGFHLISLVVHSTSLYLIIVLFLLLYTQVFFRVKFLALCLSPCILCLCLLSLIHTITHHSFAYDLQLQMSDPDKISELLHSMQSCMYVYWATSIMIKLNDGKTELMLVSSNRTKHFHSLCT